MKRLIPYAGKETIGKYSDADIKPKRLYRGATNDPLTEAEHDLIKKRYERGDDIRSIARDFRVSKTTIRWLARKLGAELRLQRESAS